MPCYGVQFLYRTAFSETQEFRAKQIRVVLERIRRGKMVEVRANFVTYFNYIS